MYFLQETLKVFFHNLLEFLLMINFKNTLIILKALSNDCWQPCPSSNKQQGNNQFLTQITQNKCTSHMHEMMHQMHTFSLSLLFMLPQLLLHMDYGPPLHVCLVPMSTITWSQPYPCTCILHPPPLLTYLLIRTCRINCDFIWIQSWFVVSFNGTDFL